MTDLKGKIHAPTVALIAQEMLALIKNDYGLRALQGQNAQQACYFDQPTGGITGPTVYNILEAFSGTGEVFSSLVLTLDAASGAGRYRVDGVQATPTVGHEVPAGGGVITITGHNNIKNFSMIAQAAATLLFARNLYK